MNYPAKSVYKDPHTAESYDEKRFTSAWGRVIGLREITTMLAGLDSLAVPSGALVVDAPAGTSRLALAATASGRKVISLDISVAMLASGMNSRGLRNHSEFVGAVVGDLETLPFRSKSIDAIACLRLMGHLPPEQKKKVLREILRVSRRGAVIMFVRRTPLLMAKRALMSHLRLRSKPNAWFADTHMQIDALIADCGGSVIRSIDLMGPFGESRVYVIRSREATDGV